VLVAAGMFGFGFALIPLYDVFCEISGINGKTGRIEQSAASQARVDETRWVTVNFVANVNNLAWDFGPIERQVRVHPGELKKVAFYAANRSGRDMVGQAVPSLSPGVVAKYFKKTECFCFSQQPLKAGERKDMPIHFVIDPDLPKNVRAVTLAYTFFESKTGRPSGGPLAKAKDRDRPD
jgi:cytochrome c oxidase assembly protein subunit 11